MPVFTRLQSLMARIDTLERHATVLQAAFRSEVLKTEAATVLAMLRVAQDDLRGVQSEAVVTGVEARIEIIASRLSRLGRST